MSSHYMSSRSDWVMYFINHMVVPYVALLEPVAFRHNQVTWSLILFHLADTKVHRAVMMALGMHHVEPADFWKAWAFAKEVGVSNAGFIDLAVKPDMADFSNEYKHEVQCIIDAVHKAVN